MQTFARRLNLIALALGVALTAPGCATDWFSSSSSDYVAGELSQDVESLPDPNAPPAPPKRPSIVSPLGAPFKESPDRLLLQANAYFEQGKFHDSARLYRKYLATPEAATAPPTVLGQARHRIAVVARKKMNFAEAKREFEIALQHEPKNQQYRFDLGKSAFDGSDYATADEAFSTLIAQNPNYPQAQYYYGLTLLEGTRRAEAIGPLTKAVGELEAAALLTDKYYELGDAANAATWETQTTQIAARLGRPVPAFPNKPAFATTTQPQVAPVAQPQNAAQVAPVAQPQNAAQVAPVAQPQNAAQVESLTAPQTPLPNAPSVQRQEPVPFAATLDSSSVEETTVLPVESFTEVNAAFEIASLENTEADLGEPQPQPQPQPVAVATPETSTPELNARPSNAETSATSADESVASSPVSLGQNTEAPEFNQEAQSLTTHIGRGNPGLCAITPVDSASTGDESDFRPGSISTTPPTAPTTQASQIAQAPSFNESQLSQPTSFDVEAAFRRVEALDALETYVAKYFAPLAPIYDAAPSPFQVAEAEQLYAAAPSTPEHAVDEDEEFNENDDFAFASSGTPQTTPGATIGGFGSYQAPTLGAAVPVPTPTYPIAQNAPTSSVPFVSQYAATAQTPQTVPAPVSQYAATRRPSTPEERLQAAIAAGADVREISPEEYRRAVQIGMSGQAQSR